MLRGVCKFAAVLAASIITFPVYAQYGASLVAPVTGHGSARHTVPASRMRMIVEVIGREADVRKAAESAMQRVKTAKEDLLALEAIADSIQTGPPKVNTQQSDQHAEMRMYMMQSMGRAGRSQEETETNPLVTVTVSLAADWDLSNLGQLELLAKTHELKQTLEAANLSGASDESELSPEDQELFEEAQMFDDYGEGQNQQGMPQFLFLAEVSQEVYDGLMKKAFDDAKNEASQLARAAGGQLGKLQSLNNQTSDQVNRYGLYSGYADYGQGDILENAVESIGSRVAVGADPVELKYTVQISAGFGLIAE